MSHARHSGFTLIEIMVALGVVALTLMAGFKATGALTLGAERQSQQLLAQLCAENELVRMRLARQLPGVGDTTTDCEQGGETLQVRLRVSPTPNPNFRRVEAVVQRSDQGGSAQLLTVSTIVGRQ